MTRHERRCSFHNLSPSQTQVSDESRDVLTVTASCTITHGHGYNANKKANDSHSRFPTITMRTILVLTFLIAATAIPNLRAAEPPDIEKPVEQKIDREGADFFESHIRPVFTEHCYGCHSTKAIKLRGELFLDSRHGVAKGGEGGPIIVPGQPDQSRLIEAVRWTNPGFQMPPKGKLSADQIEKLEQWVTMGAPDPRSNDPTAELDADSKPMTLEEAGRILWSLKPVERPDVPTGFTESTNPIDAFIAAEYRSKGLKPVGPADRPALLRRVYIDLIGLPPSPAELEAFLNDASANAYEAVVDRLLTSEQHGVRYARHWLDVLRYADADERMIAAQGIHLWRDWVISALNDDVPYDQFVRAQLTGYRSTERTQMSATGYRSKAEPRPDDLFALGLLARGAVIRDRKGTGELAISAVETISTAFMGMTVGCAKCHNHVYDPIKQRDFYAMKALFDPLVPRRVTLATTDELIAAGRAAQQIADRRAPIDESINTLIAPYKAKLYDERVAMLPADVQVIILKPERERSVTEQKIADDYFPILRIDGGKITEIMSDADRKKYDELQGELGKVTAESDRRRGGTLAAFWTVEADPRKETEKSYILTSGDPERPELNHEVDPGWPFPSSALDFREGRIEAFSDWLTAAQNPLFARVAVNRIWQWHFGEGLHKSPSDFGKLGGVPTNQKLLDWLASEFVRHKFSMKALHRLIVTSETYRLASEIPTQLAEVNNHIDPSNASLWHFQLQRLDAEPIWDSIFTAAGNLDLSVGGPSFAVSGRTEGRSENSRKGEASKQTYRRAAYIIRGFSTSRDIMPNFLLAFDVDDGRAPCPLRTQTVTPSQGLFMMNSNEVERASLKFAERLQKDSGGDLRTCVDLGYRMTLSRPPSSKERERALEYLDNDPAKLKGLAWLLFNLDEFIYLR